MFVPKTYSTIGTQTDCEPGPSMKEDVTKYVALKMLPSAEQTDCDLNQDKWFSMSTMRKYYENCSLFIQHEVSFFNEQNFIESMQRINDNTDATMDEDIDYTSHNNEVLFTKNWIRYVIVDHLKHPASTIEDDEYEMI